MPASSENSQRSTGRSAGRSAAAIFDLDRTLLSGGSGLVISRHLSDRGLAPSRDIPLAGTVFKAFELIGETRLSMELAKLTVRAAKGMRVDEVALAADDIADELLTLLQPYTRQVIEDHRRAGDVAVIASTTPEHFVRPLAERLGIDHVVASRWANDGVTYSGHFDGPFVWGRQKLASVREWAQANGVSMSRSAAYSDSYFDAPLLDAVGRPHAVNPDPRLAMLATLKGWPIRHLDKPEGVVKIASFEIQELLRPLARPELIPSVHFEIIGIDHIPRTGGVLLCANHRSYFDASAVSLLIAKAGRSARFLGKKEVFDAPVVGQLARALGGIRVERGTGSDEPLEAATKALMAGEMVAMMPEGTIPRGPAFFEPELRGRWGAARLAAGARVPVVPVGLWGTELVWPRSSRLPRITLRDPAKVTIRVGEPFMVAGRSADADTKLIMARIAELLPPEARERRTPTEEELRRTYPPGYRGDPAKEAARRPGSDT